MVQSWKKKKKNWSGKTLEEWQCNKSPYSKHHFIQMTFEVWRKTVTIILTDVVFLKKRKKKHLKLLNKILTHVICLFPGAPVICLQCLPMTDQHILTFLREQARLSQKLMCETFLFSPTDWRRRILLENLELVWPLTQ